MTTSASCQYWHRRPYCGCLWRPVTPPAHVVDGGCGAGGALHVGKRPFRRPVDFSGHSIAWGASDRPRVDVWREGLCLEHARRLNIRSERLTLRPMLSGCHLLVSTPAHPHRSVDQTAASQGHARHRPLRWRPACRRRRHSLYGARSVVARTLGCPGKPRRVTSVDNDRRLATPRRSQCTALQRPPPATSGRADASPTAADDGKDNVNVIVGRHPPALPGQVRAAPPNLGSTADTWQHRRHDAHSCRAPRSSRNAPKSVRLSRCPHDHASSDLPRTAAHIRFFARRIVPTFLPSRLSPPPWPCRPPLTRAPATQCQTPASRRARPRRSSVRTPGVAAR